MRAVGKYTDCRWVLLYVERWLKAPARLEDGALTAREKGTPQGGVISPLLANIFLHLAFDDWMRQAHPAVSFERYADDGAPRRRQKGGPDGHLKQPCCTRDEGRPLEAGLQGQASNHLKLLWPKAMVVSVKEKAR